MEKLIEIKNLKISFFVGASKLQVIRGVDLSLSAGEIVGILGESGSGKTVSSSAIMQLMNDDEGTIDDGEILFKGENLINLKQDKLREIRGKRISYVFQNPSQALNPYKKIGEQLTKAREIHGMDVNKRIILSALREVGISDPVTVYEMYPFQLSGGLNQRVMIAQSMICQPDVIIADEPTSSIDASLKKKIIDLFIQINEKYKTAIIIITHDFDIAQYLCDRVVIMYGGLVMEQGRMADIMEKPLHPYTEELKKCAKSLDEFEDTLYSLDGSPPTPFEFKTECPFYDRCKFRQDECASKIPEMLIWENREVRCIQSVVDARGLKG